MCQENEAVGLILMGMELSYAPVDFPEPKRRIQCASAYKAPIRTPLIRPVVPNRRNDARMEKEFKSLPIFPPRRPVR